MSEAGAAEASVITSKKRKMLLIGIVVVCAVAGAIVGVVVASASGSSSSASTSDGTSGGTSSSGSSGTSGTTSTSSGSGSGTSGTVSKVTSNPVKATYSLAAFAIGDWGTTVAKDSCCTRSSSYTDFDVNAEDVVAELMNQQAGAATVKPKAIISHGDNFYWTGIDGDSDQATRFATTFEGKYTGSDLADIPWVNVLGNHDYGGASYICSSGGSPAKCSSSSDLTAALDKKFAWQSNYTSPNGDRWVLDDHFYVYNIKDSSSGVSIDIFNVDSNDADTHGANEICCQCYGYAGGDDSSCTNVARGDKYCCGGDTDMYDACKAKFTAWSDDSRKQLAAKLKASTATWKIVNSHYSPYVHYGPTGQKEWFDILSDSGVHLWINGHTHGEKHDYAESLGVHFVENGAGGGIQKSSASGIPTQATSIVKNIWSFSGQEYGFFSLTASKEWLHVQYHTADDKWGYGSSYTATTKGGVTTKHCYYIPSDGTAGGLCSSYS